MSIVAYKKQKLRGGWTRVDLLLQVYDRAISSIESCAVASQKSDSAAFAEHFVNAQRAILAIHSGLDASEEVAHNVARLLHFSATSLEKRNFDAALKVLHGIRDSFASVADEANRLEREGVIPAIPENDNYVF